MTSACSSYYPEPPLLRRTDTSADYAQEDNIARLSRLERESLRIQQELADLSERMRASLPPPSSPVSRQIASPSPAPAPAPAPAPQTADATSPHFPFSVATVDMMNNFGM